MSKPTLAYGSKQWLILCCLRDFGPQARTDLNHDGQDQEAVTAISILMRAGSIQTTTDKLLAITPAGRRRLERCNREHTATDAPVALPRQVNRFAGGSYTGAELRRTCMRPGAYDAFAKPSLMGERRVYRKEIPA